MFTDFRAVKYNGLRMRERYLDLPDFQVSVNVYGHSVTGCMRYVFYVWKGSNV